LSVSVQVTVKNGAGLIVSLQSLREALKEQVQNSITVVGARILDDMRRFTPVRTGYLLSTENIEEIGQFAFVIYARAFYAPFVEWGTRRMAPRLFMTRAFELHKEELLQEAQAAVANSVADTFR
jgi:HK97 gp10 family phage protein